MLYLALIDIVSGTCHPLPLFQHKTIIPAVVLSPLRKGFFAGATTFEEKEEEYEMLGYSEPPIHCCKIFFFKKSGLYDRLGEEWVLNKIGMMCLKMGEA